MSISWALEHEKDRQVSRTDRFRRWIGEWGVLIVATILVSLFSGVYHEMADWLTQVRAGTCKVDPENGVCRAWQLNTSFVGAMVYIMLALVLIVPAAWLVEHYAPAAAMSGITGLKSYFQGFDVPQLLDVSTLVVKMFGVVLVPASGLWVGQEAPLVHVAVIVFGLMSWVLPISEARRRDLALAAAASAIGTAFGAPLGGVLFVIEVFTPPKQSIWRCFVCSVLAVTNSRVISLPSITGAAFLLPETGLFHVSYDRVWHSIELVPFALLGVFGGVFGLFTSKLSNLPTRWYAKWPVASSIVVTLVTAVVSYGSVVSRIALPDLLEELFAECRAPSATNVELDTTLVENYSLFCDANGQPSYTGGLVVAFLQSIVLMPLSVALHVPSGVLLPAMVVGALGGRLMGLAMTTVLEQLPGVLSTAFCPDEKQHCITPGVYALVGAGAVLAGITRLTVFSVVLIFETTGALSFIVPIMTGVIVSKWVSDTLGDTRSIYTAWQAEQNLPSLPDSLVTVPDLNAEEIMTPASSIVAIRNSTERTLPSSSNVGVPILGPGNQYIDFVVAKTAQREPTLVLTPQASLRLIITSMTQLGIRIVVFCHKGEFRGLISRMDVVRVLASHNQVATVEDDQHDPLNFEIE